MRTLTLIAVLVAGALCAQTKPANPLPSTFGTGTATIFYLNHSGDLIVGGIDIAPNGAVTFLHGAKPNEAAKRFVEAMRKLGMQWADCESHQKIFWHCGYQPTSERTCWDDKTHQLMWIGGPVYYEPPLPAGEHAK